MEQPKKNTRRLGLILAGSTFAVLALILVVSLTAYYLTNRETAPQTSIITGVGPLDMVSPDRIDPALALAGLGGMADIEVIRQAVDQARPETALAGVLYQPQLTDRQTAGSFLQLARIFSAGEKPSPEAVGKAVFCYRSAGNTAILSPDLPDAARADIFIQVGEGLVGVGQPEWAKFYLQQALTIARHSPYLQAAQRRTIFQRLHQNYLALGERELARTSLNLSANPPSIGKADLLPPVLPPVEPVALPAEVQEAEANRWLRAQELAANMVELGGKAPRDRITALKEALLEEDRLKSEFLAQSYENETRLSKRIDITAARINWLTLKYRTARRGYGLSLVPEWEAQSDQLRTELTKSYERLFALYADLVIALPEVSQIDRAMYEKLRREVLAGELGRYPRYPEEQRRQQLVDSASRLAETQPEPGIYIGLDTVGDKTVYSLKAIQPDSE
ncbi:MAG: hypothetical protein D6784_09080 [Chloroflexi bacterium]|nr:MAG: hypothetical protein D6784_09080 [Chloroflexota bacterium]